MKTYKIFGAAVLSALALAGTTSCSDDALEEENPAGSSLSNFATSSERFQAMVNQCYFALERFFYGTADGTYGWGASDPWNATVTVRPMRAGYMALSEAETDLWTSCVNLESQEPHYFWFFGGAVNTTYTSDFWNCAYDGIGACNTVLDYASAAPLDSVTLKADLAEAYMLRSVYYFNLVEMFGGVVEITNTSGDNVTRSPKRTEPADIYKDVILPGLEYAAENMAIGTDATTTRPPRKAAIGFLAKAYLQMTRWCDETEKQTYYEKALAEAEKLIQDCESDGKTYNTHLYTNLEDVFKEENNWENKEALWKQRWVVEGGSAGASTGIANLNRNDERFLCQLDHFGARLNSGEEHLTWAGSKQGNFMPTQHLINLYVQEDGTLDPRFHQWFTTEWPANQEYTWSENDCTNYDKNKSVAGRTIKVGQTAIKIVVPQDVDYQSEMAKRDTCNYLLEDYKELYSDANCEIIANKNGGVNNYRYFYPSLNKHNSSNYYKEIVDQFRMGNLNATFIMRTPEVYFIAAEADLALNKGKALTYINKIRTRAGANPLTSVDLRTIIDERGRELCGEYNRFFDLARVGYLSTNDYLSKTHPDLAKYWNANYVLKPVPSTYTDLLDAEAAEAFTNPGY